MAENNHTQKQHGNQLPLIPIGTRFHRLVITGEPEKRKRVKFSDSRYYYPCLCDCGNERKVESSELKTGGTKSCGCLRVDNGKAKAKPNRQIPEYNVWVNMRRRCNRPNNREYSLYGGRGILVCQEWNLSFETFLFDMGQRPSAKHSIDRIDNNGNYEKTNCRWATQKEQCRNTRVNRKIEYQGREMTIAEASELSGVGTGTITWRINWGMSSEKIFSPTKLLRSKRSRKEK